MSVGCLGPDSLAWRVSEASLIHRSLPILRKTAYGSKSAARATRQHGAIEVRVPRHREGCRDSYVRRSEAEDHSGRRRSRAPHATRTPTSRPRAGLLDLQWQARDADRARPTESDEPESEPVLRRGLHSAATRSTVVDKVFVMRSCAAAAFCERGRLRRTSLISSWRTTSRP